MIALIVLLILVYVAIYIVLVRVHLANVGGIYETSTFTALAIWAVIGAFILGLIATRP
jgi:hypothetical protein